MSFLEPLGAPLPQIMQILVIAKGAWGYGAVLALMLSLLRWCLVLLSAPKVISDVPQVHTSIPVRGYAGQYQPW